MSEKSQAQLIDYERHKLEAPSFLQDHLKALSKKYKDIKLIQLSHQLQSQSSVNELIQIYSDNVQSTIPHSSISFENKLMEVDVSIGTTAAHSCAYNLKFSKESLGKLTLTRHTLFSEDDLKRLEDLLCILFYPLGHAIYN